MVGKYATLYACLYLHQIYANVEIPELTILLSNWNPGRILKLSFNRSAARISGLANGLRPVAIDYDPVEERVYWTDVALRAILARDLNDNSNEIILSLKSNATLDGIAIDSIARKIFYTDTGNDVIVSLNMNGTGSEIIVDSGLEEPRGIVLHEENRKMYWSDWGRNAYIASANYDGTKINRIVTTGLGWPNGLTMDRRNGILYWCDSLKHTLESVQVDGTSRTLLLQELGARYFGIFFHDGVIYYTDRNRRTVFNIPSTGGTTGTMSSPHITTPVGIHVFSNRKPSECPAGQYGDDCQQCGNCKARSVCEKTTGQCLAGCADGYKGSDCRHVQDKTSAAGTTPKACPANTYGPDCAPCGMCAGVVTCSKVGGTCPAGCQLGWTGDKCDRACLPNTYGASCEPCGQCAGGVHCDKSSGLCPNGCQDGWSGSLCKTQCIPGTYGAGCLSFCSHCKTGTVCHQITGECPAGCQQGWSGAKCDEECKPGAYGKNCASLCSHCMLGSVCNHVTGQCPNGCQSGWSGDKCDEDMQDSTKQEPSNASVLIVVIAASAGGVVLLIIIAVVAVVVLTRRKRQPRQKTINQYDTAGPSRLTSGYLVPSDQCPAYLGIMRSTHPSRIHFDVAQADAYLPMSNTTRQPKQEEEDHIYETPVF
ncbi:pro-epidermal growth factor-like [Haliotis asinina]|uniref:pro-epidermal growth factor-like n=1 Tax=Haliotis asinina TaxID=109174 RepID=UPI003531AFF0